MPITGLPEPNSAVNAVGIFATPRFTAKPAFSAIPASASEDFFSWYPGSAHSQMASAVGQLASACVDADLIAASFWAEAVAGPARRIRAARVRMGLPGV